MYNTYMKTITELNKKWWYRLVKVLYVLIFVFASVLAIAFISTSGPFNSKSRSLRCDDGRTFTTFPQPLIFKSSVSYDDRLKYFCLTNADIGGDVRASYPQYEGLPLEEIGRLFRAKYPDYEYAIEAGIIFDLPARKNYSVIIEESFDLGGLLYGLLLPVMVVVFFELLRRAFYYILLGSLKPPRS